MQINVIPFNVNQIHQSEFRLWSTHSAAFHWISTVSYSSWMRLWSFELVHSFQMSLTSGHRLMGSGKWSIWRPFLCGWAEKIELRAVTPFSRREKWCTKFKYLFWCKYCNLYCLFVSLLFYQVKIDLFPLCFLFQWFIWFAGKCLNREKRYVNVLVQCALFYSPILSPVHAFNHMAMVLRGSLMFPSSTMTQNPFQLVVTAHQVLVAVLVSF